MRYFKKLVGTKCYLSPVNLEDAETYAAWLNDLEVTRTLSMGMSNITVAAERQYLEKAAEEHLYGINDLETDALIGNVGLHEIDTINRTCVIGIFIGDKAFWGKGYGPEAMRLLMGYGFDYLNMHSIKLTVYAFNPRAQAAYVKAGFKEAGRWRDGITREGRFHDVILMDILEDEFRSQTGAVGPIS